MDVAPRKKIPSTYSCVVMARIGLQNLRLALGGNSLYVRRMRPVTSESFGLLIAFMIPGLIALWGLSQVFAELSNWIGTASGDVQTFGGFLNLTVASIGAGLTASTVRWLVIDPIHHWTGLKPPDWNMKVFHGQTEGLQVQIETHYRYYQFYANCLVSIAFASFVRGLATGIHWGELLVAIGLVSLFFIGSRDTLSKYYSGVTAMLR